MQSALEWPSLQEHLHTRGQAGGHDRAHELLSCSYPACRNSRRDLLERKLDNWDDLPVREENMELQVKVRR